MEEYVCSVVVSVGSFCILIYLTWFRRMNSSRAASRLRLLKEMELSNNVLASRLHPCYYLLRQSINNARSSSAIALL